MSVLTAIQYVCGRTGVPVPASVLGTTDVQVLQMLRLLEEEGNDLSMRGDWQALTIEKNHVTTAAEDQGAIATIASNGFRYIKNDTLWDRDTRLPILGPLSPIQWQSLKAFSVNGPRFQHRIRQGKLLVNPTPAAGLNWYFEYLSKNWILGADAVTYKQYFTLDTDTILLPEDLCIAGLRWRWKKEKGLDYAEDFRTYEMQVKDQLGRDGGKPHLYMDGDERGIPQPGIWVTQWSWPLP